MKSQRALLICTFICLGVLALEGLWMRRMMDDPLTGWLIGDNQNVLMPWAPRMSPETAGPWTELLKALPSKAGGQVREIARRGTAVVQAVRDGYRGLLEPLTLEQRAALLRPSTDLVDPLYPGIDADPQRVFFYCVGALRARADGSDSVGALRARADGAVVAAAPYPPVTEDVPYMPEALFWRLGRLARDPGHPLTPDQAAAILERIRALGDAVYAYDTLRADLWTACGLPPRIPARDGPPPFPFPPPRELRAVGVALTETLKKSP